MLLREFVGEEYYKWARQEYDTARNYLKHCGKPEDKYDVCLLKIYKETVNIFRKYVLTT